MSDKRRAGLFQSDFMPVRECRAPSAEYAFGARSRDRAARLGQVKKGPLAETSPMLNDISGVPSWEKVCGLHAVSRVGPFRACTCLHVAVRRVQQQVATCSCSY